MSDDTHGPRDFFLFYEIEFTSCCKSEIVSHLFYFSKDLFFKNIVLLHASSKLY